MTNQQLLIGGVLLWFWMQQRDKPEAPKIIVQKSSTSPPPATDDKAAAAAKLRSGESLEQTQERERTIREKQWQGLGYKAGDRFLGFLEKIQGKK